jgi:hypothetical protein
LIEPADLAGCLWKPFPEDISGGGPVYFTFSAELVRTLITEGGYGTSDPVSDVCAAARQLYSIAGNEAVLHEDALDVGPSGRSLAIVLVCQQVLAVESMVRDPNGFSENAYFPRLRRLMSPLLDEVSTNPFHFSEFEAIWRALARDIRSIPGYSDASITFRFGVESGVNKARAFPLSQALLTLEDLRVIALRTRRLERASPADVWRILRQVRHHLSRRAQRLIGLGVFRERVADQVISYLKVADAQPTPRDEEQARTAQRDIIVFRDTSDWLEAAYRAYLRSPESARDHDEARIQAELAKRIGSGSFLLLALTELGDCWVCANRTMTIQPGENFLIVGEPACMPDVDQRLRQYGIDSTQLEGSDGSAGRLGPCVVMQRMLSPAGMEITVRNGRASSVGHAPGPAAYHWSGGLAVDARGSKFLREYLPTHVEFSDGMLPFEQLESVNGRYISAESFVSSLAHTTEDTTFEIGFPGGRTARLSVGISRLPREPGVGYPVDADGSLDVGLVGVSADDFVVSGFYETSPHHGNGFDIRSCALLLRALRARIGQQLSPTSVAEARRRVQASKIPDAVRGAMLRLLVEDVRLPSRLCIDLGI